MTDKKKLLFTFLLICLFPFLPLACSHSQKPQKTGIPIESFVRFETVKLDSSPPGSYSVGFGSGFIIKSTSDYSLAITNSHVCQNQTLNEYIENLKTRRYIFISQIRTYDDKIFRQLIIIKNNQEKDLCLVKIMGLQAKPIKLSSSNPTLGDEAYLIGSPKGFYLPNSKVVPVIKGMYIGDYIKDPIMKDDSGAMYNMTVYKGQSGSAILNSNYELIGVLKMITDFSNISLSIRTEDIREFIKDI